jgi:hypothetical protein
MAELTTENKNDYQKLQTAFLAIGNPQDEFYKNISVDIKPVDGDTKTPRNIEELRATINKINLYIELQSILGKTITFGGSNVEASKQEFWDSLEKLRVFLNAVGSEALDLTTGIKKEIVESLLLAYIDKGKKDVIKQTKKLLNNDSISLTEEQIKELIKTWEIATGAFVKDALHQDIPLDEVIPLTPKNFAYFFRVHDELENLYSNLANTEKYQSLS